MRNRYTSVSRPFDDRYATGTYPFHDRYTTVARPVRIRLHTPYANDSHPPHDRYTTVTRLSHNHFTTVSRPFHIRLIFVRIRGLYQQESVKIVIFAKRSPHRDLFRLIFEVVCSIDVTVSKPRVWGAAVPIFPRELC